MEEFLNPVEKIKNWISDKPVWWKHSIRLAIQHGELDSEHLSEIYSVARISHRLDAPNPDFGIVTSPIDFSGHTSEKAKVELRKLAGVMGVGALASDQTLSFTDGDLIIVYGDNGAGKSSYANILKDACLTRGEAPNIIGNVFLPRNINPQAQVEVSVAGENETISWSLQSKPIDELKAIRVFDTSSASHYVSKEDALGFKPDGLNLLTELNKAIAYVKAHVEEDIMPGNGLNFIPLLNHVNEVAQLVNNLSAKHTEGDITKFLPSGEELARIEPLRREIVQNKHQSPETIRSKLNQQKAMLSPLSAFISNALRYVGSKAIVRLKELQQDYKFKQQNADSLKKAALEGIPFDTVAGVSWQSLWAATKSFIEQEPTQTNFPLQEGESCPVCLQDISTQSAQRMATLQSFIQDNAASEARQAHQALQNANNKISGLNLSLQDYQAALVEVDKLQEGLAVRLSALLEQMLARKNNFVASGALPGDEEALDTSPLEELNKLIADISNQSEAITSNEALQKLIKDQEQRLSLLESKVFVQQNLDALLQNLRRLKIIEKMEVLKQEANSRRVSTLSSTIYQEGVIEPLKIAFDNELKEFGFNRFSIDVKTRNSSGLQQFKLALTDAGGPVVSKIASEGEQRCIAIAAFLAEMQADKRESAIVFDDPVNSLSHQWSSRVAARLVKESAKRQVVIFTHDIVFFKLLLEQVERQGKNYKSIALERNKTFAGIVKDAAPWEALTTSKRLKALGVNLRELKKIESESTEPEFRQASRHFYGLLRECWERLVEEKLLNKVVSRFERGVHTLRLSKLTDITEDDIKLVNNAMSKCSTCFTGHDSATPMGDPFPTYDEVESDFKEISVFLEQLQGKRKRN